MNLFLLGPFSPLSSTAQNRCPGSPIHPPKDIWVVSGFVFMKQLPFVHLLAPIFLWAPRTPSGLTSRASDASPFIAFQWPLCGQRDTQGTSPRVLSLFQPSPPADISCHPERDTPHACRSSRPAHLFWGVSITVLSLLLQLSHSIQKPCEEEGSPLPFWALACPAHPS